MSYSRSVLILIITASLSWANCCFSKGWEFDFSGMGAIKVGMKPSVVMGRLGGLKQNGGDKFPKDNELSCSQVYFPGFGLLFNLGKLEEVRISSNEFRMANGLGVGSTFHEVKLAFRKAKNVKIETLEGHYSPLVLVEKYQGSGSIKAMSIMLDFETDSKLGPRSVVQGVSIGRYSVDGCGP